jgi:cell wall-associated NlpC family hydrolase
MEYAIITVPAAPVRKKARHQSEMTSQLLFGEAVKILKSRGKLWVKIRSLHDGYEGWLTHTLLTPVDESIAKAGFAYACGDIVTRLHTNRGIIQVPFGSGLPGYEEGRGVIGQLEYSVDGNVLKRPPAPGSAGQLESFTQLWLNAPYLWGGRTMFGVDCSGFVQVNFKMLGIDLPRDAWQQAQSGETVRKLKESQRGDLAFFNDKDEIVHVGILLGDGRIIHSSGKVRIDQIDKKGIINSDTGHYTHDLRLIKRCW